MERLSEPPHQVLREGAAATYGSDAIAGVVNFITRSGFRGFEVEARHKAIGGSNGDSRLSVVAGSAFGAGAGHSAVLGEPPRRQSLSS